MKSITSKLSIIILSLLASTFALAQDITVHPLNFPEGNANSGPGLEGPENGDDYETNESEGDSPEDEGSSEEGEAEDGDGDVGSR